MIPHTAATTAARFTACELRALRQLRARYRQDRDLYTTAERARLRFVRWLYHAGRLDS